MAFGEMWFLDVKSGGVCVRTCSSEGYCHAAFVTSQAVVSTTNVTEKCCISERNELLGHRKSKDRLLSSSTNDILFC